MVTDDSSPREHGFGLRLPKEPGPLVIRTDYGDEPAWLAVRREILAPAPEYGPTFVDDPVYEGAAAEQLRALASADPENVGVLFIVDDVTIASDHHLVLVVDLADEVAERAGVPDRCEPFRTVPEEVFTIGANILMGNLWLEEFADGVDENGVLWS